MDDEDKRTLNILEALKETIQGLKEDLNAISEDVKAKGFIGELYAELGIIPEEPEKDDQYGRKRPEVEPI